MARDSSSAPLLVVDDDPDVRGLVSRLLRTTGHPIVTAATGEQARAHVEADRPALVVLDVNLPDTSGYELCRELRDAFGETLPIIFLSGVRTESYDRVSGLLVGADDYIVKPFAPDELVARVRRLLSRSGAVDPLPPGRGLTPREVEVLDLLAAGHSQREIAEQLVISEKTVATHIQNILPKLGVHSRAQAVAVALRDGLSREN